MKNIRLILFGILCNFLFMQVDNDKLYITIQMMDQVGIINLDNNQLELTIETEMQEYNLESCMDYSSEMHCNMSTNCEWMMGMCMESDSESCMDYSSEMDCNMSTNCEWMMGMCMESNQNDELNTPHFIVLDERLGYWFVTTIASGYVAQYSLIDNELIDSYFVGDAPAILTIDTESQKIYCSRMMPMNGMGNMMPSSESNTIQSLNYSHMGLTLSENSEFVIDSPAPHGIAIDANNENIFTASNTADWIYKIDVNSGDITGVNMDLEIGNPPDQTTQRLKPIQCLVNNGKLFVTCSAGPWYNPFTGETTIIPGQLQMWDTQSMTLLDSIELGDYTSPWHVVHSPNDNIIYVALAGDNLYNTGGVAAISYIDNQLESLWLTTGSLYDTPHGIEVSNDGEDIYLSDRGNGNIYIFNKDGEIIETIFVGSMSMLGGIALTKNGLPDIGDVNVDSIVNVVDIILAVNNIVNNTMLSPYPFYAADTNMDDMINVTDIITIVNIITN